MQIRFGRHAKALIAAAVAVTVMTTGASAETLTRSLSYFTIGGATPEEIEKQLTRLGPRINGSEARHPGATRLQFSSTITYAREGNCCRIAAARVGVKAEVILPRWRRPANASDGARLFWDVLSADIVRHEESHLVIGGKYAREIERALVKVRPGECQAVTASAQAVQDRVLSRHDLEQQRFDRVEARNLDRRLLAKLKARMNQARN